MAVTIIDKKAIKYRQEIKYPINYMDYHILKSRLSKVLKIDSHANPHGYYHVVSLYFDDLYDKALNDKINGTDRREKFRIRYYDNLDVIKLEKKLKYRGLCAKYSTRLTIEEVKNILNNNYSDLIGDDALKMEFYTKLKGQILKPKTIIRYKREAYLYPVSNIRLTLDSDIRTTRRIDTFLSNKDINSINNNLILLEVKYNEFLPDIIKDLVSINRRASAFSKYALSKGG